MNRTRSCLFGGALFCAGLPAHAQEFLPIFDEVQIGCFSYAYAGSDAGYGDDPIDCAGSPGTFNGYCYLELRDDYGTPFNLYSSAFWSTTGASAFVDMPATGSPSCDLFTSADIEVNFTITERATARIEILRAEGQGGCSYEVLDLITGESLLILSGSVSVAEFEFDPDNSYKALLGCSGFGSQGARSSIRVEILPSTPCPADLDGDGDLTLFDFLAFQNLFDAGDPLADFDGDGSLTIFDFLAFQNEFDAGCP